MGIPELTREQWRIELERAVAGHGSNWRVNKAIVERWSPMCHAELANMVAGTLRQIAVARDRFVTADARMAEISRQLGLSVDPQR
jgi:hypothetical protein